MEDSDKEKTAFALQSMQCPGHLSETEGVHPQLEVYIGQPVDDIIIFSKSADEHLHHMQDVFERPRQAKLKIKPKNVSSSNRVLSIWAM